MKLLGKVTLILSLILVQTAHVFSATWYVAPTGSDANTGTITSPFVSLMQAQTSASAGDTVYLRGGTYSLSASTPTTTDGVYQVVNFMNKSGINYMAYPGELPVFDFTNIKPSGYRVSAFVVTASNLVFQGFDVIGVQVTIQNTHTQSECFRIEGGDGNKFIGLRMHDGMANGFLLWHGSNTLVLNCDAYNNAGLDGGSIGNTDGFGMHPKSTSDVNNVFRGCRAWFNSDDGFDCIGSLAAVTFDHCWAFYNGYYPDFTKTGGDGNGIKGGGYGIPPGGYPNPIPHHLIEHSMTVKNRANGFYANHHATYNYWYDNTAYQNGAANYNMDETNVTVTPYTDGPGYDQVMRNNLGFAGGSEVSALNTSTSDDSYNYFTLSNVTVSAADFVSLDESQLTTPRQPNGNLPHITFARLASSSDCINAGADIGFPYVGAAPDLGAFESGKPDITWLNPVVIGTADATLSQPGAVLGAACFGATAGFINVTLTNGNVISFKGDGSVAACTGRGNGTGVSTLNTGNAAFDGVLNGAEYDNGPHMITLKGLIAGQSYAVQVFALDDRGSSQSRFSNFQDPYDTYEVSQTSTMGANTYTVGTFTATGTTATIRQNLPTSNAGNTNALVIYSTSVPVPWLSADIGAVGFAGVAGYANGVFSVTGSGADIWSTVDAFQYVYQPSNGDCSIQDKVVTQQVTSGSARAGVMIRETLAPGSINALVDVTPDGTVQLSWRSTTGGQTSRVVVSGFSAPIWTKLTRTGNSFTGYYSTNGTTWTAISTQSITMATNAYIGMPVCAHDSTKSCTVTYSNVTATP